MPRQLTLFALAISSSVLASSGFFRSGSRSSAVEETIFAPPSIIVFKTKPGKSTIRELWVLNNYGENFEIESISSDKGIVKIISQEKIDNRYKFELKITAPDVKGKEKLFKDVVTIAIKGGKKLKVPCRGFYSKY